MSEILTLLNTITPLVEGVKNLHTSYSVLRVCEFPKRKGGGYENRFA